MTKRGKVSFTPFAQWLNEAMSKWQDPETGVFGISQLQLERETGITQSAISGYLIQGRIPKHQILHQLALFFDVDARILYAKAYYPHYLELRDKQSNN